MTLAKGAYMKLIFSALLLSLMSNTFAGPECTKEGKSKWQNQKTFEENLVKKDGYKIKKFKVTDGNCYEIYGWDKSGKKVEIYFNPVDGSKVKVKSL